MQTNYIAPAPWKLKGNGVILLYSFPFSFIKENGFLDEFQAEGYRHNLGAVMLMDYKESEVGPYRELLFIPGMVAVNGKWGFSISKIYVSTYDSARSGKRNWGIPKELADFKIETAATGIQTWTVRKDGNKIFEINIKERSFCFPLNSSLLPFTRLIQKGSLHYLLTKPTVMGKARLARVGKIFSDPQYFPPVDSTQPVMALCLNKFEMGFPVARQIGPPIKRGIAHVLH